MVWWNGILFTYSFVAAQGPDSWDVWDSSAGTLYTLRPFNDSMECLWHTSAPSGTLYTIRLFETIVKRAPYCDQDNLFAKGNIGIWWQARVFLELYKTSPWLPPNNYEQRYQGDHYMYTPTELQGELWNLVLF